MTYMTKSRKDTAHTEFRFDDGEVFTESHRTTWGGWVNMVKRVEARFGDRMRPAADDTDGTRWTVAGRTFTTAQVQTF